MYKNLMVAVKRRIIDEVQDIFDKHPVYSNKVKVTNRYPYTERVQYGAILQGTSSSQIRLAPDNYMGEMFSHVALAKFENLPGIAVEWAREDSAHLTNYQVDEDVSSQLDPTQRMFTTIHKPIVSGNGNTLYANNFKQIMVTINGSEVFAEFVNGEKGIVLLHAAPQAGDVVKVSYWYKVLSDPGRYYLDFITDNHFMLDTLISIEQNTLIERTTGTETTLFIGHANVKSGSDEIFLQSSHLGNPLRLTRDTDYSIDDVTGNITFLNPLPTNYRLYVSFWYQMPPLGPFAFEPYQEINNAIPGVVISIGKRAKTGDKQVILLSKFREPMARIYGGHWTMNLELKLVAKNTLDIEEMSDHVIHELWGNRKNVLEFEGLTMNSVEPTGETEEVFNDVAQEMYYENMVSISMQTEWQKFVPYMWKIEQIIPHLHDYPKNYDYYTTTDNRLIPLNIVTDPREVVKYPTVGYERIT